MPRFAVKDRNLANVRKGFRCKRLPQSRGSFAMTGREGPYSQFPAKRVLTRNDKYKAGMTMGGTRYPSSADAQERVPPIGDSVAAQDKRMGDRDYDFTCHHFSQ